MPLGRALVVAASLLAIARPAWSAPHDDDDDDVPKKPVVKAKDAKSTDATDKKSGDDDDAGDDDDDSAPKQRGAAATAKPSGATTDPDAEMQKQDLTGHDLGTQKHPQPYEKDRFFVDKVDTDATEDRTLIQGSVTFSALGYFEKGGPYGNAGATNTVGNDTTAPATYWGDLRLQTDFRHIDGGRWDGRVDFRARFVDTPDNDVQGPDAAANVISTQPNYVQSGYLGQNEYDLRELWLVRNGVRTDLTLGRQFIADLGAIKIDGVRFDYASSPKLTYLGFVGLYPQRGSRSLTTDYEEWKTPDGQDAGRFVGAAGFGGAYRTQQAYGAVGAVAMEGFSGDESRLFVTSQGYWRINPQLDFYHFALIDILTTGDATITTTSPSYGPELTNLSAGLNYKPNAALRLTASFNRVDTDTLNIQAASFFTNVNPTTISSPGYVLNEIYINRLASNEARASISAALGHNQRFELTAALSYKERPDFTLTPTVGTGPAAVGIPVAAAQSVEIYGSVTDRHSIANLRLGIDGVQTITVGSVAYERSEVFALRGFAGRELASGNGEWEAELSYASTQDVAGGDTCTNVAVCFGASSASVLSLGGTFYYRITRNWFTVDSAYVERTAIKTTQPTTTSDAPIDGLTLFGRIAYRF